MMLNMPNNISASAFLVNESRAKLENFSRDIYASNWIPEHLKESVSSLWYEHSKNVYPHSHIDMAMRSNFFLTHLELWLAKGGCQIFINLGCGLTSYAYLTKSDIPYVEIDLPEMIFFKQQRAFSLLNSGVFPKRNVVYLTLDLDQIEQTHSFFNRLNYIINGRQIFVLIEGVSYYLRSDSWSELLNCIKKVSPKNSLVAFDFWQPSLVNQEIYGRLTKYFRERFKRDAPKYNLIAKGNIQKFDGYEIVEITGCIEQEQLLMGSSVLLNSNINLDEHYVVMRRV